MNRIAHVVVQWVLLGASALALAGCGGGGGSGGGAASGGGTTAPPAIPRETPLALASNNAREVQGFSQFALQQTTDLGRTVAGYILDVAAAGAMTAQHQCFIGSTTVATLALIDRDNSHTLSAGDGIDIDDTACGLTLVNIPNLPGSIHAEVHEFFRGKSGDIFVRARITSVGNFSGLARRADPPNGIPNDVNATLNFAFELLAFGTPTLERLQIMSGAGDAIVLHEFDNAAYDRQERLSNFAFEHRIGSDGRYWVTYRFDADADGIRVSFDNITHTIDLRGRFHCETTTPISSGNFIEPDSGAANCTGASSSRLTATSDSAGQVGVLDLRVDPEGDGTFVTVLTSNGTRGNWSLGELQRYLPFHLAATGDALPRTFARPIVAFANRNFAVADAVTHTLYTVQDRRLTVLDAAGTQLRSTALPFTRGVSAALSDDGSTVYVSGDENLVVQLRTSDLASIGNVALGDGGIPVAPRTSRSIAVAPGTTDLLLVATDFSNELVAYRNGAPLPNTLPHGNSPSEIAFRDTTTLIGMNSDSSISHLYTIDLTANGPVLTTDLAGFVGAQPSSLIDVRNPVLTREGRFIDIDAGALTATLGADEIATPYAGGARDPAGDYAYMLGRDGTLVVYEVTRQARIRTYQLSGVGAPLSVLSLGNGTFAALGSIGIQYFTRSEVVDSAPLQPCGGADFSNKFFDGTYIVVDCPLRDAVFDAQRARIYATVRQQEGVVGNGFISIDPANATTSTFTYVGSSADGLRLASDGSALYVTLAGASTLERVGLGGAGANTSISLGISPTGDSPTRAYSAAEFNGSADDLIVSGLGTVMRYRNGARTAAASGPFGTALLLGSTPDFVFAYGDGGGITKLQIDNSGISASASLATGTLRGALVAANDHIYDSAGSVVAMNDLTRTHPCNVVAQAVLPDLANNRIYYVTSDAHVANVTVCTPSTGALQVREVPNFGSNLGDLRKAIDVGSGRFALVGSTGMVILAKADF